MERLLKEVKKGEKMELLTVTEAAQRLRLGRSTVYLMAQRGDLPVVRFGAAVRIPAEMLDRWVAQQAKRVGTNDPDAA